MNAGLFYVNQDKHPPDTEVPTTSIDEYWF